MSASLPAEHLIFTTTGEGLLRGLQGRVTPGLKARLAAAGLDADKPMPLAWPATRLPEWLNVVSDELFADLPRSEAHRQIGLLFTRGWQQTLLGGAVAAVFRVIGPQRALATIARAFRTGDNFTQTACEVVSDHAARVTLRTTRLPHFVRGQLEGGLEFLKLPGTVTVVVDSDAEMVFEVAWQR